MPSDLARISNRFTSLLSVPAEIYTRDRREELLSHFTDF
jgi:hypothetical protein